jgi:anti-sigma B factor antagonist
LASAYLSVAIREHERSTVLHIEGELDLGSSRYLEEAISEARRAGPPLVVLDVEHLDFIDMAGLRVLIAAHARAEEDGQRLVLANVRDPVRRVLTLARVDELLPETEERRGL